MSNEPEAREWLLIALGGSGRRTAVALREKIAGIESENSGKIRVTCRVLSIDFSSTQDTGYVVSNEEYFPLLTNGENLFDQWARLDIENKKPGALIQPWMKVGFPSEMELYLARDAQQSGIRRVDYQLLLHNSIERISKHIRSILEEASVGKGGRWMGPNIIILGSLAGRTSSISYVPVLKVLEELSKEFIFDHTFSFLYTPKAIQEAYYLNNPENSINSLAAINQIVNYFWGDSDNTFLPAQFLINNLSNILASHRDENTEVEYNETVENILKLIYVDQNTPSWNGYYFNWMRGGAGLPDLTGMKDSNNINHRQIFAMLDSKELSLSESGINEEFFKQVHPGYTADWVWIEDRDQRVLCGTMALSPWVFSCLTKPVHSQISSQVTSQASWARTLEILYSNGLYNSIPASQKKISQIISSLYMAFLFKKIKVIQDVSYCEFQFMPSGDKKYLSLKIPTAFREFFASNVQALVAYLPFALLESSKNGQLSSLDFYQIDGEALLSDFIDSYQSTEEFEKEATNLIAALDKRIGLLESESDTKMNFHNLLISDLKKMRTLIANLEFKPFI